MKKHLIILLLLFCGFGFAQNKSDKEQIQQVMKDFFAGIKEKDSAKFYSVFHDVPVTWVGVYKDKSYEKIQHQNHKMKPYFSDSYGEFFKSISGEKPVEEKYDNVKIIEDGNVASVNFDYSFWYNNKMLNWGKEIWTMVKVYGNWKITSVIFSMEMTEFYPQPKLKERLKKQ